MCTGFELAAGAAALSTAGAGAQAYGNNQALRSQDREAAAGIMRQAALQRQAQSGVADTIQKVAQADPKAIAAKQNATYVDALRRAAATQKGPISKVGGASDRYNADAGAAQDATAKFGTDQAALMARTDAPQLQRMQESQQIGREATNLGLLNDTSSAQAYLTKLRTAAIQPNPWIQGGGALLKGAGAGMSAYGAAQAAGSVAPDFYGASGTGYTAFPG